MIVNGIFNSLIAISGPLINLISIPIAAKALGTNSFGEASITLSFISYFSIISTLGLAVYGTRELASVKFNKYKFSLVFTELLILSASASCICSILYGVLAWVLFSTTPTLIAVGVLSLSLNFLNIEWLYYSKENYKIVAYSTIVTRFTGLALIYLFVNSPNDVNLFVTIQLLSNIIPLLYIFYQYKKYVKITKQKLNLSRHFKSIRDFLSIRIFSSVYSVLDIMIVGLISSASIAGLYTIAIRVARIVTTVICSMTAVAMPRASALFSIKDKSNYNELVANTLVVAIILSTGALAITLLSANITIFYLGGSDFKLSQSALVILSFLIPIVGLSNFIAMQLLYPNKKEKIVALSLGLGSLAYITSAPLLIILYQLKGAAFAVIISELVILISQVLMAKKTVIQLYKLNEVRFNRLGILTVIIYIECIYIQAKYSEVNIWEILAFISLVLLTYFIGLIAIKEPLLNNIKNKIKI
jgi:O-antigen/teichoic acid export membrane protein